MKASSMMLILSLNESHTESSEGEKAFWLQIFLSLMSLKYVATFIFSAPHSAAHRSNTSQKIMHKEAKEREGAFITHTKMCLHVSPYIFHRGGTLHLNRERS